MSCGSKAGEGVVSLSRLRGPARGAPEKKVLLITTPFATPNYVYPSAAYLARYLRRNGVEVAQADLNLELLLALFSRKGLARVFDAAEPKAASLSERSLRTLGLRKRYESTVEPVIRFLQGRDASLAFRLSQRGFLPRGHHFDLNQGFEAFDGNGNTIAIQDRAKFVGTLYLYDIADLVREAIFPYFQITLVDRYYDSYVHRCTTFDQMNAELTREPTVLDEMLHEAFDAHLHRFKPDLVGLSVPFARNLYYAFRMGKRTKEWNPDAKVAMGGGFFNTSMREQYEPRVFDYVDYITLDDGEKPILDLVEHLDGRREQAELKRTWLREDGALVFRDGDPAPDAPHEEAGTPDYTDYKLRDYFSSLETNNVTQRVRVDGWWNKMTMAHGCYWKKCSFCDVHLAYVGNYETQSVKALVDKVEEIMAQTGHSGFHFVDEAMPPKIMRDFAIEVLRRDLHISWHGMMRFDKAYTPELCRLLAASGLVAIFGGLEVASDRLLTLMEKGTSVDQVTRVAKNFKDAGIRVHAYIMYGFPTQTEQETIDAADVVRQLFKHGLVSSASWAKFGVTPHSPVGRDPAKYKIEFLPMPEGAFVEQIIPHLDPTGANHDLYSDGLSESLKYWSLGFHHDTPTENWFNFPVPPVSIDRNWIARILENHAAQQRFDSGARDRRVIWLGVKPSLRPLPAEPGQPPMATLVLHQGMGDHGLVMSMAWATWLMGILDRCRPDADHPVYVSELEHSWDLGLAALGLYGATPSFEEFLHTPVWATLQERGLILTQHQRRVIWTGAAPTVRHSPPEPVAELVLQEAEAPLALKMPPRWATWLAQVLERSQPDKTAIVDLDELKRLWTNDVVPSEERYLKFADFLRSPVWNSMRTAGLTVF
ncbi:MAG TPA: B12-binding domain-containing radical SAM protein [Haliangiales bacterium]|nr:B12-binding domain-containing radical SAM protein [Haliangiales bacterium]